MDEVLQAQETFLLGIVHGIGIQLSPIELHPIEHPVFLDVVT